jgi:hypothetical protein
MDNEFKWWSIAIVVIIGLIAIFVIDGQKQVTQLEACKQERIKGLSEKFFTWNGILELSQKGQYQPRCL